MPCGEPDRDAHAAAAEVIILDPLYSTHDQDENDTRAMAALCQSLLRLREASRAALIVVRVIRKIARRGRSVVCTIHQPSADLFYQFDRLLLLKSGGREVYFGPVGEEGVAVADYFLHAPIDGSTAPAPDDLGPEGWELLEESYRLSFRWFPRAYWDNQAAAGVPLRRRVLAQLFGRGQVWQWRSLLAWKEWRSGRRAAAPRPEAPALVEDPPGGRST